MKSFHEILLDDVRLSAFQIVDVREPCEVAVAKLPDYPQVRNLPLSTSMEWKKQMNDGDLKLSSTAPTIIICHRGLRSHRAGNILIGAVYLPSIQSCMNEMLLMIL